MTAPDLFAIGLALADGVTPPDGVDWYDPEVKRGRTLGEARHILAGSLARADWTPSYQPWRHGGWYVNLQHPGGGCGCVSRNFDDRKWRVVCFGSHETTYPNRDAAAYAEREIALAACRAVILEYLRGEIHAERISYGELAELQDLAAFIDPGDVELLEWAGVPEEEYRRRLDEIAR